MRWNGPREPQWRWLVLALSIALVTFARVGRAQEIRSSIGSICEKCGVTGGLCVQVGSDDLAVALELARTGRVLVQILDTDAAKVERTRTQIHTEGLYGLISVNRWASGTRLPYTENLVNLVLIEEGGKVPLTVSDPAVRCSTGLSRLDDVRRRDTISEKARDGAGQKSI